MDLDSPVYNMPSAMILLGEIDKQKLTSTFRKLIKRHESFRTSFITVNEEPVQKIQTDVNFEIEYDFAADTLPQNRQIQNSAIIRHFIYAFDLTRAPLLRVGLSKLEEEKHLLMFDIHHIISDGISMRILIREFMELYLGKMLSPMRLQYKDYAQWQNSRANKLKTKKQEKFWLNEFPGDAVMLVLPTDFSRPPVQSFDGNTIHFELGEQKTALLNKLALQKNTSLFMLLAAIFNILLSKLSGQEDIVIGVPIGGREHPDLQSIIGIFVNTLALRNFPIGDKTFHTFLEDVRLRTLKAFENEDYQFEELVDKLALKREADRNPLFDVMFALLNKENQIESKDHDPSQDFLKVHECEFENKVSRFDMSWNTMESDNCLDISVEYSTKLFKKETIERFTVYFKKIIDAIIAEPGIEIAGIEVIPDEERQWLLYELNNTTEEYPLDKTLHELFEQQVQITPGHVAVFGHGHVRSNTNNIYDIHLTYRELNDKSGQLAMILIEKGALTDCIVGIMMSRSVEMMIGIMGILKSGAAYLPIDPEYPKERIDYMLKDSSAAILLTDLEMNRMDNCQLSIVNNQLSMVMPDRGFHHSSRLAYIIYTSGSTGKPKGVAIEHRSAANLAFAQAKYFHIKEDDHILQFSSFCFDASVEQIFIAFFTGAVLILVSKETLLDMNLFKEYVEKLSITHINAVPAFLNN
ncbi:MAG: condensation domain-containing protein, partial [Acidobacteria bacterium]|nr:condensation domain-containing protein [Acidobacteriota bacterium]